MTPQFAKTLKERCHELHHFCWFLTGNSVEALHLTEKTFKLFLTKFDQAPSPADARLVLFQMAMKFAGHTQIPLSLETEKQPKKSLLQQLMSEKDGLFEHMAFHRTIANLLMKFPNELKIPLLLNDIFKFPLNQIVALLEVPVTTVSYRISQARGHLIHVFRTESAITTA